MVVVKEGKKAVDKDITGGLGWLLKFKVLDSSTWVKSEVHKQVGVRNKIKWSCVGVPERK